MAKFDFLITEADLQFAFDIDQPAELTPALEWIDSMMPWNW